VSIILWPKKVEHAEERATIIKALAQGPMGDEELQVKTGLSLRQIRSLGRQMKRDGTLLRRSRRWFLP